MKRAWIAAGASLLLGFLFGGNGVVDLLHRLEGPSPTHLFGTDELGRDLLLRWWLGGARALTLGLALTALHLLSGTVAALAAHSSLFLRRALLAAADAIASIPSLLLCLFLLAFMRPGYGALILALAVGGWIPYARLALSQLDSLKLDPSLQQTRLMGAGRSHLWTNHLLPRLWPILSAQAAVGVGAVVLAEGGLSFLGLGLSPEQASWGSMLAAGRAFLLVSPWQLLWPSLGLLTLLLATESMRSRDSALG
jgi:peptide/nickel transport system permease protein